MKIIIQRMIYLFFFFFTLNGNGLSQSNWEWQNPLPQGNALDDVWIFNNDLAIFIGRCGTIIKTTDGGESFTIKHNVGNDDYNLIKVYFQDERTGWIFGGKWWTNEGVILKTTNCGDSWYENYHYNHAFLMSGYFVNQDTGYAVGNNATLIKTTNGGYTWDKQHCVQEGNFYDISFLNGNLGYIVGNRGLILKTVDGGTTWASYCVDSKIDIWDIQILNEKNAIAVTRNEKILRTIDSGSSWFVRNNTNPINVSSLFFEDSLNGWVVGWDPYVGRTLSCSEILRTSDSGTTLTSVELNAGYQLSAIDISDKIGWVVGHAGGIIKYIKDFDEWIKVSSGTTTRLQNICCTGSGTVYVIGAGSELLKTVNYGENWQSGLWKEKDRLNSIYFINSKLGWALAERYRYGNRYILYHTNNGGNKWSEIYKSEIDEPVYLAPYFIDETLGFMCVALDDSNRAILRTDDGGYNWIQLDKILRMEKINVHFKNGKDGIILCGDGRVYQTVDKGLNWIKLCSSKNLSISSKISTIGSDMWVINKRHELLKSTDWGRNWIVQYHNKDAYLQSLHFINAETGYLVGGVVSGPSHGFIAKTTDGGGNWVIFDELFDTFFWDVDFTNQKHGWAVGSCGAIIKIINE